MPSGHLCFEGEVGEVLTIANSQMFVLSLAGRFDLNPRQDPLDASSGNQRVCADRPRPGTLA